MSPFCLLIDPKLITPRHISAPTTYLHDHTYLQSRTVFTQPQPFTEPYPFTRPHLFAEPHCIYAAAPYLHDRTLFTSHPSTATVLYEQRSHLPTRKGKRHTLLYPLKIRDKRMRLSNRVILSHRDEIHRLSIQKPRHALKIL